MNYQLNNGTYDYVLIGEWNNGSLNLSEDPEYPTGPVESVCSKPCSPGFYKVNIVLVTLLECGVCSKKNFFQEQKRRDLLIFKRIKNP